MTERLPDYFGYSPKEIQVLSPMKRGLAGVESLNRKIQKILNPSGKEVMIDGVIFRVGDKVMQTVNNYNLSWEKGNERGEGVFNGDIGYIRDIDKGAIEVEFEDGKTVIYDKEEREELILAYAVTVHKSQGSEFRAVILSLSHSGGFLNNRNLLYTAVTRARETVVIVCPAGVLKKMVYNNYIARRYSLLKEFIWESQRKTRLLFGS